jgi:DNA-binding response OmpR family regulator
LDIVMPGISGYETCRRIKLSPLGDSVCVILVSAEQTIVDRVRGADVLADDYVSKPFNHVEMLAKVRAQFDAMKVNYHGAALFPYGRIESQLA